ncbi:DUF481 domain-containing protein [Candidatus Thiothrix sp. Deng01]|uniref:DUF481 domain-containing protein n=1 Tax=Candidatus Thiothrix phosphatis TaxID=3112415 RepID=A0ABU6CUY5_9GAMM|nr:DUF481 domain-containing protein [Candidatus Thiothrix sp. Deng01]MEB4590652.1 DUF481 domain-containing protein [Candidatus Thiothrix sp. Deng01]
MKKQILATSIAIGLTQLAIPAFADVTLYDYEQPSSAYEDAYVSGRLNVNSGNQDQTSHDLSVDMNYERVFSSPDRDVKVSGDLLGTSKRGPNTGDDTQENYVGNGSVSANKYFQPNSKGAFWYGDGEVGVKKGAEDPRVKVGVGLGYGRVVNVTPMAQALRLVEALRNKNRLTADLTKAEYNQLANVIAKESEYRSRYGAADYQQNWVNDMETALEATGKTNGKLDAIGILKAYDVLVNERISTRKYGWLVKAGVSEVIKDYDGGDSKPALDVAGEYHRPLSNRTQFSNEASASTILQDDDKSYTAKNNMSLTYEMSDRVDWLNSWALNYDHNDKTDQDTTTNALSSTYRYYLSNKLAFDTVLALSKVDDDITANGNDEVDKSLYMGVTYRLK